MLSFGPYQLDPQKEQFWWDGQPVRLPPKVFQVLCYLAERPGQLVTKEELFQVVWADTVVGDAALTMCIQEIRKALQDNAREPQYLETVHRRGFRFIGKVVSEQLSVVSQTEGVSSQQSIASSQKEESQKLGSLDAAQRNPEETPKTESGIALRSIRAPELEVTEPLPFSPSSLEPTASSLSQDSALNTQNWSSPASVRSWSKKGLVLAGVLFGVGMLFTLFFSRLSPLNTQDSALSTEQAPEVLALPDKPSLVILPFLNLTGDPNQEIIGDGIVEGMTTGLAKLPGLFIISQLSAFTYKGKAIQIREVSRELGVRYVVAGSIQKAASDHIRVTAQLIDATTSQLIWAEEYDRPATDIFVVRDDITRKLVTHVAPKITALEQALLERTYAGNPEAYDYFVRGEFAWRHMGGQEENAKGRHLCQKAVEIDPSYAHAYTCIGYTYFFGWQHGWTQDPQALDQILDQVLTYGRKAAALDDSLCPAHELIGVYYLVKQEYELALTESWRAVEVGPSWSSPYSLLGATLIAIGRSAEAIPHLELAVRLMPRYSYLRSSYLALLGDAYRLTGQYDKAIETLKKSMSLDLRAGAFLRLIATYSDSGHDELAHALAGELLQKVPQFSLDGMKRFSFIYRDPAEFERFLASLRKAGLK